MIREILFKDHDEWLSIRSKYIGGSDAGAVIGMNPYKSAYTLWAEKTGRIAGFDGNLTTKVGSYLEEFVAKLFEEETGKKVRRKNRTIVNDLYPFACANIDRAVVGEKALLEIKTTNSVPIMKQIRTMEFPEAYYAQVVHYLAVTGLEKAYLAVLVNCRDFRVYELYRDEAEIEALMRAEADFWNLVERDVAPSPDGSSSTSDTLLTMYPNSDGSKVDLFAYEHYLDQYQVLNKQIKELTALRDEQANIVKEYMKDAEKGESARYVVTSKSQIRKTFDKDLYLKHHGSNSLDGYYKESVSRPIRIKEKK